MNRIDQRMAWLRLLDAWKIARQNNEPLDVIEVEFASEKYIPAILEYGNIYIKPYFSKSHYSNSLQTYYMRIEIPRNFNEYNANTWNNASRKGYYSKGFIQEILDILALISRARFYIISFTHLDDTGKNPISRHLKPIIYNDLEDNFYPPIMKNKNDFNWEKSIGYLDLISSKFPENEQLPLMLSLQLYHSALKFIGIDHEHSYLFLVSSIESLLVKFKFNKKDDSIDHAKIKKMIRDSSFTDEEKDTLNNIYMFRGVKRKFNRFLEKYSKGYFKGGRRHPNTKLNRESTFDYKSGKISVIYDARSKFLHEGKNMYIPTPITSAFAERWDISPNLGSVIDRRLITASEQLPYLHFFEGLVNHTIKKYIEEKSK